MTRLFRGEYAKPTRGEMPHCRSWSVEAERPGVGFCLLFPEMMDTELFAVNRVVVVPVTSYNFGVKLNMAPSFSVMAPWESYRRLEGKVRGHVQLQSEVVRRDRN